MNLIATILGGLGVFLLGMKLLSDNLRSAAGDALRMILARFTDGKLSSVGTGTVFTALVQSSSATTLAAIGFVSAGLLTFTQAVGVIFGANLGTTATSWLVATLGLGVSISAFAYPMVGVGALISLLTKGRKSHFGAALAGFGLIFVGIDILQVGMGDLAEQIDLTAVDPQGLGGMLMLVGIGFVMTVLMQSSSAAIATTLTALFAGAVDLPQAAVLVVGQSVGTTVTAALGAIGASLAARRTAVAHILFNVITAVVALSVLPLFLIAHGAWMEAGGTLSDAVAVAIYHTSFKLLGVVILLPVLEPFSKAVYRMVPGEEPQYAGGLDDSAAAVPAVGVEAARRTQLELYRGMVEVLEDILDPSTAGAGTTTRLDAIGIGLTRCRDFLDRLQTDPDQESDHRRHLAVLHTQNHLERLHRRLESVPRRVRRLSEDERLETVGEPLVEMVRIVGELEGEEMELAHRLEQLSQQLATVSRSRRHSLLRAATGGDPAPGELERLLEAIKWCYRSGFHLWRAAHYLEGGPFDPGADEP